MTRSNDEPIADIDHARVLARALHHARAARRQLAQVDLRRLVGAVLRPQRRGDPELGVGRPSPEHLLEVRELVGGEPELARHRGVDGGLGGPRCCGGSRSR